MSLTLGQKLTPYSVVAFNFASDSDNKIHDDAVARRLGFAGGLVPGVADYAYMTRPVVETLGEEWLAQGFMRVRFLRPVYDGDRVEVRATVLDVGPARLGLELVDPRGELCALGEAGLLAQPPTLDEAEYLEQELPGFALRPAASLEILAAGTTLGSVRESDSRVSIAELPAAYRDDLDLYRGAEASPHPALLPHWANEVLHRNVRLGPWIHTASEVQHLARAKSGRGLTLCGRVREAFARKGHETVVLDLALFDRERRPIACCLHTAIIRPRQLRAG